MNRQPGNWSRPLFNCSLRGWRRLFARYPGEIIRGLRTRCVISGSLASALESMQERLFGAQLDSIDLQDPVFIIGHWRSGTTYLHELMALDENLLTPTTHQCFNPQSFLLSKPSGRPGTAVRRPSGDRMVSADSPQEEEWALLCLGCPSPYEAFLFPSALRHVTALCDPGQYASQERADWERRLVRFLKAVTMAGGPRRLLLKSPSNSLRIDSLRRLFPGAAFVHITREPSAVIVSTIDMWQKMWLRYACGPTANVVCLENRVIEILRDLDNSLQDQIQSLPDRRFTTVKYEDVAAEPHRTLKEIYDHLNLGACPADDRITRLLKSSPPLRHSHPTSPAIVARARERCAAIFDRYGYG
jgi:hypothetical protein